MSEKKLPPRVWFPVFKELDSFTGGKLAFRTEADAGRHGLLWANYYLRSEEYLPRSEHEALLRSARAEVYEEAAEMCRELFTLDNGGLALAMLARAKAARGE